MAIWSYIYKVCTASDAENSSEFDMKNWSKGPLDVQTKRVIDGIIRNGIILIKFNHKGKYHFFALKL